MSQIEKNGQNTVPTDPIEYGKHVSIFEFENTGKLLGTGTFSDVYLAINYKTQKKYALKIINKQKAQQKNTIKYVVNERNVALMLDNENIIRLFFTSRDQTNVYMFFEHCLYGELWDWIRRFKHNIIPEYYRVVWVAQIVLALEHMHSKGIAHRDVKPENIFISEDFNCKLGDLGTSKIMAHLSYDDAARQKKLQQAIQKFDTLGTKSGGDGVGANDTPDLAMLEHRRKSIIYSATKEDSFTGTPHYMAPEVVRKNNTRGTACDLWSLGVLMYQLEAGELPFTGEGAFAVFLKMEEGVVDYSKVSPTSKDLIEQLLVVDPKKRLGVSTSVASEYRSIAPHIESHSKEEKVEVEGGEDVRWCEVRECYVELDNSLLHVDSTPNGWAIIKAHDYFKGIDWNKVKIDLGEFGSDLSERARIAVRDGVVDSASVEKAEMKRLEELFGGVDVGSDDVPVKTDDGDDCNKKTDDVSVKTDGDGDDDGGDDVTMNNNVDEMD